MLAVIGLVASDPFRKPRGGILTGMLDEFSPDDKHPDQWNLKAMDEKLVGQFGITLANVGVNPQEFSRDELGDEIFEQLKRSY